MNLYLKKFDIENLVLSNLQRFKLTFFFFFFFVVVVFPDAFLLSKEGIQCILFM